MVNRPFTDHRASIASSKTLKWVIDVTIGYPDAKPLDLFTAVFGDRSPCQTIVHYRAYHADAVPRDEAKLTAWLYERFVEKEQLLDAFYKTGRFPVAPKPPPEMANCASVLPQIGEPRLLAMNDVWCLTMNVMFLLSSYFHYCIIAGIGGAVADFVAHQ